MGLFNRGKDLEITIEQALGAPPIAHQLLREQAYHAGQFKYRQHADSAPEYSDTTYSDIADRGTADTAERTYETAGRTYETADKYK